MRLRPAALSLMFLIGACEDPSSEDGLMCQDEQPDADVSCGADDESCIGDALMSGTSVAYTSTYQENAGQYDSSTTTVVVGDQAWTRHSGVEDLCAGDSLTVHRNPALLDCETLACVRDAIMAAPESMTCFDTWACDAV